MLASIADIAFIAGIVAVATLFLVGGRPFVGWSRTFRSRTPPDPTGEPAASPDAEFQRPPDEEERL